MTFYLKVVADGTDHKEFPSVSPYQNFSFVKPGMSRKVPCFWQFFDFLICLKGVVFYFEQFEDVAARTADEMGLSGTDSNRSSALDTKITDGQASTATDIQEHELVVGLGGHTAGVLGLRRRKCYDFKG